MNKVLLFIVASVIAVTLNTIVKTSHKAKNGLEKHFLGR